MTAIIYKDWIIVGPQESIRPYSMSCSNRVFGQDREFFALSSETAVVVPMLGNLSLDHLKSGAGFGSSGDVGRTFKLHFLHKSGMFYTAIAENYLFDQKLEVTGLDTTGFLGGDIADFVGIESATQFLKGVIQNTTDPHEVVRYMSVLWPDLMSSYYAIPLPVFLEWMKAGAEGWPFEQFPKGSYTEYIPDKPQKPVTLKKYTRKAKP